MRTTLVLVAVLAGAACASAGHLRGEPTALAACVSADATPDTCCGAKPTSDAGNDGNQFCCMQYLAKWVRLPRKAPKKPDSVFCDLRKMEARVQDKEEQAKRRVIDIWSEPKAMANQLVNAQAGLEDAARRNVETANAAVTAQEKNDQLLADKTSEAERLRGEITQKVNELDSIGKRIATINDHDGNAEIQGLKEVENNEKTVANQLSESRNTLRTELETLSKSLSKCTTDSGKAAADKQRVEAAIAALQTRRDQLALDAQRAQDDLTTAQTKLSTARQEAETARTKLTEEEQGVATLTSQIAEVRKSISGINKKAAALLRSAARDNAEAADLEADVLLQVFVSGDSNSQSSGSSSAPAEALSFEEYVARLDALITTLRNHLHAMKAVATEIAAKKAEFDAKDEALKASMTTAQQEADRRIADVIAEIERLNAQLLQSNQAIRTALHNKRLAEDAVAAAITAIRESIAAVQENRRSLNADIGRIQSQITQITTDLSSCMDSNSELQSAVAALEGKLQTDTADLDAIAKKQDQEIEAINQQIADANRARDQTTRQTSDLRDQQSALEAQRLTLTGELSTAESDMTDAKANHAAARRTRKEAGDRLDAAAKIDP